MDYSQREACECLHDKRASEATTREQNTKQG